MTDPSEDVFAFPASFAEQRLWFLDQVDPMTSVYNVAQGLRLEGPLQLHLVERCLQEIVRRHESLRTTFAAQDGSPLQLVAESVPVPLRIVDLAGAPDAVAEALRLANAEAQQPFDLQKGPLLRALAVVLGPDTHVLVLNAHHIVCDGGSLAILFEEMSRLYLAFAAGEPSPLPEVTTQYADFAIWQSEWIQGTELERALAFWRPLLTGDLTVLELPGDRPRPQVQSFAGGSLRFEVPAKLSGRLGTLARQEGVSLFMLLLTAWNVLLHRLSGQDEILVGTPVANRERAEIERSIGFYTNTVVFRTHLGGAPTFHDLLGRVRAMTMDVLVHQDVPFEKVVEAVHPARATSHNPIFQTMFGLQKAPESALQIPGIDVRPVEVHSGTSKFDMTLDMQEVSEGMQGLLEYSSDLFDRDTAARLAKQFVTLLAGIADAPTAGIEALPLLDAADRLLVLEGWNDTEVAHERDRAVHELVSAQASRTPAHVAVEFDGQELTYADLDRRAGVLAAHLASLGVAPGSLVAVCMDRSIDMVVALHGVLRSGGAYLPLDPAYPADRLAYMIEDSKARIVLTDTSARDELPDLPEGTRVVVIDEDQEAIASATAACTAAGPEDRAYVIYTSGSTGKPKGVEVPHRAFVNFLGSMATTPGIGASDRLFAVTTLSFDIAGLELFLPLTVGATVVLSSRETATDARALSDALEATRATMIQATPATYRMLVEDEWSPRTPLRALCGGEVMPPALAGSLLERVTELWNMYGPTETTIWSTCTRITDAEAISIGRPIANTRIYVLDARLEPVPIGVSGDLYIAGDGVALGYLDRAELSAERFVADPFRPGTRMYRTGDKARFAVDGNVHFLGRGDTQVKIRGFRIELGEIETVLAEHADLRQVVVVVCTDGAGDARIVAYVVHQPEATPTPSELRKHLRQTLPDHMIPHFFVELPAIPLTQNGKVDRRALPDPFLGDRKAIEVQEAAVPATDAEKIVAEIWRELLKVNAVSLHDNFFDLGGHSLLSMQVIHRIAAKTGHRLNPRSMVYGNLQQISAECERRGEA